MLFLISSVSLVGIMLMYVAYHQLYQRGLQAEAKLMISYVHTLERVYKLENKTFVFWDEPYGASLQGQDNCAQPDAAAEVGFIIAGCHRDKAPLPRYAYRIVKEPVGDHYMVEASSGSDSHGRSFVCFQPDQQDVWQSSQNLEFNQIESCW
ncbi:MAG: hypothetical protein H7318_14600 [Oligoflexus sp.]|nr:hypothetical protein [Oligoflexus sp.]